MARRHFELIGMLFLVNSAAMLGDSFALLSMSAASALPSVRKLQQNAISENVRRNPRFVSYLSPHIALLSCHPSLRGAWRRSACALRVDAS